MNTDVMTKAHITIAAGRWCSRASITPSCAEHGTASARSIVAMSRSLFVVKNMSKGDVFTRENLSVLRPGAGLPPIRYEEILGKKASRNINAPALLEEEDWC